MSAVYLAVVRRGYKPVVNDDDEVHPSNIGALKKGLQALLKEDADDEVRANQKWAEARALLAEESEADSGPGANGAVQVSDDFFMAEMSNGRSDGIF